MLVSLRKKIKEFLRRNVIGGKNSKISRKATIETLLTLEDHVLIKDGCRFGGPPISIGRYTGLMNDVEVIGPVTIKRYCAIARNVLFQGRNHWSNWNALQTRFYKELLDEKLPYVDKGGIEVGNAVWIGTQVIVLPGVTIGDGAIIGAGSIVTKDVEPYSIAVGVPAVHKKYRFKPEVIQELLEIKWWDWPLGKIKRNKEFFMTDLTSIKDVKSLIVE
ncbi:MAG: antibiotic acetyltransferase [Candidatus Heimdallarchaeota archaeon]|nr:antibiotic acetyltransferase [Candidatus Heimdallarchaeota archaeon]